ncbi:hypothetical protein [Neisseria perflava]|uniref:hypothetical protein n=1 Tax=Neisseria perflava TaxID=33053 RepID=UPI0020A20263|nr:hypothetical protein [Neisseria perflava]MCP1659308.1 hypothetical protein [Neisseria perflava]MCP1772889.1 hypothetical protein [Neisseria perflava]
MTLSDKLLAAGCNPALSDGLQSLLTEAAQAVAAKSAAADYPDEQRVDFLEDQGHFLLIKPDGGDFRLTRIHAGGGKTVVHGDTLREVLDKAAGFEWAGV